MEQLAQSEWSYPSADQKPRGKKRKATAQLQSQGHLKHSKHNTSGHPYRNENNHLTNCTRQKQQTNLRKKQNISKYLSTSEIVENTFRRQNKKKP